MPETQMKREIAEIPNAVSRLLEYGENSVSELAKLIRERDPHLIVTVARGSSDHACTYIKYASEILLGLPVASLGPSVASIYGTKLRVEGGFACRFRNPAKAPISSP